MKVTDNEIAKARKSQFYPRYIKRGIDLIISFLLFSSFMATLFGISGVD